MKVIKVSGKRILAGLGILLLLAVLAGCSEAEKLSWERLKDTHYRMITGQKADEVKAAAEGQAAGQQGAGGAQAEAQARKKVSVALYFAHQNGDYLVSEKREIVMVPGLARAAVQELINGPKTEGLSRTIPEGTKLRDINIQDGLCTVDLSKEFRDNHWGGSSGELLTVYSIVNTLTQFPTVESVEVLVEGQRIDTLAGHMDLSVPVYRNSDMIKGVE